MERRIFVDPWPESAFRNELADPLLSWVRVARRDGLLAGYLVAWRVSVEVHLTNVGVVPEFRRQGVAQALLDDLLAEADRMRAEMITLEVRASNLAAIALYERNGFRRMGVRRRYYTVGREDALVMTLDLAARHTEGDA
ncbi:MAG: ribosomal protein S18-alanine N-acetyltransferase [Candidatus Eisenbacteria bacterium]|nr:ribosomal protein S18-alanine N-acetyltransferase [Candidatus Eisenbacteria bacterium]